MRPSASAEAQRLSLVSAAVPDLSPSRPDCHPIGRGALLGSGPGGPSVEGVDGDRRPRAEHPRSPVTGSARSVSSGVMPGTRRRLPTGTITFLFSDIEGSTRMVRALGQAWPPVLERHREVLRTAFSDHDGVEMGTEGDSFFVVFVDASAALAASVDATRGLATEPWPADAAVSVRIGIH